jgi:dsDNA-binding SOS-regulon protein
MHEETGVVEKKEKNNFAVWLQRHKENFLQRMKSKNLTQRTQAKGKDKRSTDVSSVILQP